MSLENFLNEPMSRSHEAYQEDNSFISIYPAPEFATSEVVISSMYRALGFAEVSEAKVPALGKKFLEDSKKERRHQASGSKIDMDTWGVVLNSVLDSPQQRGQKVRRFQMCPLVPDVALYAGTSRRKGNSWNPGQLIKRMIVLGAESEDSATKLWEQLFLALSVTDEDDIWARWLSEEFALRKRDDIPPWSPTDLDFGSFLPDDERRNLSFPAQQFVRDLAGILETKNFMTRRQWVSLLEAIVRLGVVSHVLWQCDVNSKLWVTVKGILQGWGAVPDITGVQKQIVSGGANIFMYGKPMTPIAKRHASGYLVARIGLNAILWELEGLNEGVKSLSSCHDIQLFLKKISDNKDKIIQSGLLSKVQDAQESEKNVRLLACKKGIGASILEFVQHVLGQRQTSNEYLRGYDQGYFVEKQANRWVISMGPGAILAIVYCCLRDAAGPRSIKKLSSYLDKYGFHVESADVTSSDLGKRMRMLGLVLDSPDAEGGMLLTSPFNELNNI